MKTDTMDTRPSPQHGRDAAVFIALSFLLEILALGFLLEIPFLEYDKGDRVGNFILFTLLCSVVFWVWGCYHLSLRLEIEGSWGFFGIFGVIGLAIIIYAGRAGPRVQAGGKNADNSAFEGGKDRGRTKDPW
jgi:hypothetical protein